MFGPHLVRMRTKRAETSGCVVFGGCAGFSLLSQGKSAVGAFLSEGEQVVSKGTAMGCGGAADPKQPRSVPAARSHQQGSGRKVASVTTVSGVKEEEHWDSFLETVRSHRLCRWPGISRCILRTRRK
jgi:hypothetical protein